MNSHKRKHEQFHLHGRRPHNNSHHPSKRHRSENVPSSHEGPSQDSVPIPPLPKILPHLEHAVFTHASIAVQKPDSTEIANYERLEFLGDAQLELMASEVLFERYSSSTPGKLSAIREHMVRNDTLSKFSRMYGFDKRLNIGLGSEQPREWTKIHADMFEAYIAAIVLSNENRHKGFDIAKAWAQNLWEPILKQYGMASVVPDLKSKEELSKQVLVTGVKLVYRDEQLPIMNKGAGSQTYFIGVYLNGWGFENFHLGSGTGESKNIAGQQAAKMALTHPKLEVIKEKRRAFLEQRERQEQEKKEMHGREKGNGDIDAGEEEVKPSSAP